MMSLAGSPPPLEISSPAPGARPKSPKSSIKPAKKGCHGAQAGVSKPHSWALPSGKLSNSSRKLMLFRRPFKASQKAISKASGLRKPLKPLKGLRKAPKWTIKAAITLRYAAPRAPEVVCQLHSGVLPPHQISARGSQPSSSYEVHVISPAPVRLRLRSGSCRVQWVP